MPGEKSGADALKIGELLVKEGRLTKKGLKTVLAVHEEEKNLSRLMLGQILVQKGFLSAADLKRLLQHPHLRKLIGALAVGKGFVSQGDINQCLKQKKPEHHIGEMLGQILVQKGVISKTDLERLLRHRHLRKLIGLLAVENGLVSQRDIDQCLKRQNPEQYIGEMLVQEGFLTEENLQQISREQINAPRLGELAAQLKMISQEQLDEAVRIQQGTRSVGEICCDLNLITPLDLYYVLSKYNKQGRLGEIIVGLGYITAEQLNKALQEQQQGPDFLGEVLVRNKLITRNQLHEVLAKQANIPFKELEGFVYSEEEKKTLSGIVSQKYAEKNLILPISLVDRKLQLALLEPEKIHVARELRRLYGQLTISCILTTEERFSELFEVLYNKRLQGLRATVEEENEEETLEKDRGGDSMQIELEDDLDADNKKMPAYGAQDIETKELVNYIIKYGITHEASDIHLEQDRKGVALRYRIDGVLREANVPWLKKKIQARTASIISRIKIISSLDIAERRIPQDGVFRINYYDKARNRKYDLDFRVATCPAINGENVTIRILDSRKAHFGLDNLSLSPHVVEPLKVFLKSASGIILVTGPTGSGKSSTLYGALQYVYNPMIKIITAEDPIEYSFPGIMQTQVNTKIGLSFAKLLRSFLRLDPDVIFIGEMRDEETAKIGFDAAQTGHLVLSTLHTNDAVSAVARLADLGIDRGQMSSCLSCVMAQRLARRICPSCITEYVPEEDEWRMIFDDYPSHLKFYHGTGCDGCGFSGYQGRTALSEIFIVDNSKLLAAGADVEGIKREAVQSGMKTMLDDGLLKLRDTTISEIVRVVPHDVLFRLRADAKA